MRGMNRKPLRPRDLALMKKRKRMLLQRHPDQRPDSVCMFFMQGKCQKGDDCPYSHDALPPRKMELCKFYLMDCCAKKDKCLYMHHDFPCKFHHTGLKCYAGDRCKFSHGPLSDVLKNILLRHLETAPKEILGDFPRLSREGAAAMVHNKKHRDYSSTSSNAAAASAKSIPSLFDIEVPVPLQFIGENEDDHSPSRKTTPMPSDNEDQEVVNESSPAPKEPQSPSKRLKNRWDNSDETNKKPSRLDLSRHEENKHHWDEEIRKQQQEQQHEGDENERWDGEGKQRDDGEKKKRRSDKEKKPRWDDPKEGKESNSRRRDGQRDEEKKWESEDRRNKKRYNKEKSGMYGDGDNFGENEDLRESKLSYKDQGFTEQMDQLKPMMRCYKENMEETTQSQRLLRLAGYSGVPTVKHVDETPKPLDLDTDAEDKDDLVMDFDEMESSRKESVDEAALVIDTREDDYAKERDYGSKEADATGNNFGDGRESPVIPLHIQKLPKKQQELFLRIQQQQREQQENEGASAQEEKEEDQPEESWYSSDDEEAGETSLSAVLKKLSSAKVSQPDPDFAQKVNDLTKVPDVSDAVNKLMSSIGMRAQADNRPASSLKTGTTLPILPLPPLPLPQPVVAPRDPRLLSRDPRKRQESSDARTSQDSPTPGSSSSSSSRVDPRARRRSSAARSIYDTISLSGPEKPSTSTQGDTDLRGLLPTPRDTDLRQRTDTDLRTGYGDLDLRVSNDSRALGRMMSPLTSNMLTAKSELERGGDVDLRRMLVAGLPFKPAPQHAAATEIDGSLNSHPAISWKLAVATIPTPDYSRLKLSSADQLVRADPRLRKLFKISSSSPASPPAAAPALVSPTPSSGSSNPTARADPRRLASQVRPAIPEPQDLNQSDSMYQHRNNEVMMNDPFLIQNQQSQYVRNDLMTNPMLMQQQMVPTMDLQSGQQPMSNIDPRMFRNAPQGAGLLGDAPFYPTMPHYEEPERDNSNGSDTDLRMYYQGNKRGGNVMEMQDWEHQQMVDEQHHSSYRNNNRNNWRGNSQRRNVNRTYDKRNSRNNRSYTPPM